MSIFSVTHLLTECVTVSIFEILDMSIIAMLIALCANCGMLIFLNAVPCF